MSKFTQFLDDDKKSIADNDARRTTPKLYQRSREIQVLRISFLITLLILVISLLINFLFLIPPKKTSSVTEEKVVVIDTELPNEISPLNTTLEPVLIDKGYKQPPFETMPICSTTSTFKSWMDYKKITSKSSSQWKLQQIAKTDESGFRKINDYYMVAMAKQYGPVGTKYLITFSGGSMIYAMIGDLKAGTTCTHNDSSMVEFIVSTDKLLKSVKSSGNANIIFKGTIVEIRKVAS